MCVVVEFSFHSVLLGISAIGYQMQGCHSNSIRYLSSTWIYILGSRRWLGEPSLRVTGGQQNDGNFNTWTEMWPLILIGFPPRGSHSAVRELNEQPRQPLGCSHVRPTRKWDYFLKKIYIFFSVCECVCRYGSRAVAAGLHPRVTAAENAQERGGNADNTGGKRKR